MRALVWKEWCQNLDRFVLMTVIAVVASLLTALSEPRDWFIMLSIVGTVVMLAAAVFFAVGVAAQEQGQGTDALLRALPVAPRLAYTVKLFVLGASLFVVVLATVTPGWIVAALLGPENQPHRPHPPHERPVWLTGYLLLWAIPVYLWSLAAAAGARNETRGLARVLIVVMGLVALTITCGIMGEIIGPKISSPLGPWIGIWPALTPAGGMIYLGSWENLDSFSYAWRYVFPLLFGFTLILTSVVFVWRIGQAPKTSKGTKIPSSSRIATADVLGPALRNSSWSLWRINGLSSLWLSLGIAALLIASLTPLWLLTSRNYRNTVGTSQFAEGVTALWMIVGFAHGAVLASQLMGSENQDKLADFWRTRPIGVLRWFSVRLATAFVLLPLVYVTPLALDLFHPDSALHESAHYVNPLAGPIYGIPVDPTELLAHRFRHSRMAWVLLPVVPVASFAVTVLFTAWWRNGVYSAIVGCLALLLLYGLPDMGEQWEWLPDWNPFDLLSNLNQPRTGDLFAFGLLSLMVVLVSLALAARSFHRRV
ncbi:MAG: hypothetical protein AAGA25_02430 [Planctomycetota bacterium]